MDDIHMPTVPSGSQVNGVNGRVPRTFAELTAEKDRLEGELSALSAVLESNGVNMDTSLTTFDGFPRADIDVAQIRMTRARIIHLRNDYKSVMNKLEAAVQEQFAAMAANPQATMQQSTTLTSRPATDSASEADIPFATVDDVAPRGPAESAGLSVGDKIVRFGSVNWLNHDRLRKVGEVVTQNEGRDIVVVILRQNNQQRLRLTPRRDWGGRGLLGCHLVPIS